MGNVDQNAGVRTLDRGNGFSATRQNDCFNKCSKVKGATGCEIITSQHNHGCYVHTQDVFKGNGRNNHLCWIFEGGHWQWSGTWEWTTATWEETVTTGRT